MSVLRLAETTIGKVASAVCPFSNMIVLSSGFVFILALFKMLLKVIGIYKIIHIMYNDIVNVVFSSVTFK